MPIIIDANRAGDFNRPISAHAEEILRRVQNRNMRIVFGGKLGKELFRTRLRGLLVEWTRAGRLCRHEDQTVNNAETRIMRHLTKDI